jgi:Acidobacterial duplicated orphan permease
MSDLRFAVRMLRRSPGFTLAVIGLLAAGIGSTALIFSVFDAVLMRPLPVTRPHELVRMVQRIPQVGTSSRFHYSFYRMLSERSTTLTAVFGEAVLNVGMNEPAPAEQIRVHLSTPEFFEALGVRPLLGRTLLEGEAKDNPGMPPAVLSYGFWRRRFNGDAGAVGRTIVLHGHHFVIVGVMPQEFNGISADTAPDVRVPLTTLSLLATSPMNLNVEYAELDLGGRLKPGITRLQAQAECRALWRRAVEASATDPYLEEMAKFELRFNLELDPLERGVSILRDRYGTALKLLIACAGILLLIACANVSGLLLARSAGRREEIAVRLALGSTRMQLARQMLMESFLLAALGVLGGLLIVFAMTGLLVRVLPPIRDLATRRLALSLDLGLDHRVLFFSLAISVLTVLFFGLVPAISASRTSLDSILRGAGPSASWRGRRVLIVFQVAFCTMLLAGAALLVQTVERLNGVDPGFDRDHVVTFTCDPSISGYTVRQTGALVQGLTERVGGLPGVLSVGLASRGLMRERGIGMTVARTGERVSAADFLNTSVNTVSPGYFDTLGIRILRGRGFTTADDPQAKPAKAVVNQAFVRRFFRDGDALGRLFGASGPGGVTGPDFEIIGVASDAKYRSVREPMTPICYRLLGPVSFFVLHVRTQGRPESMIQPVRRLLATLDPALPFTEISTLAEDVEASTAAERLTAELASSFGALAALLTGVGIYGLLAYAVALRQREIGIRMALGARQGSIAALIGRQVLGMVAIGVAVGLGSAAVVTPWIRSILYGVAPSDPKSFAAAAFLLVLVAAVATAIPVARATNVQPAAALRQDH